MNKGLNWVKVLSFLGATIALVFIIYAISESVLITAGFIGVMGIFYVASSNVAARHRNPKFKELLGKYGEPVDPPKGKKLVSGNAQYGEEILVVHVCPMESGFYFYKGKFCSSIVKWGNIRSVSVIQEDNRLLARFVLGPSFDVESGNDVVQEIVVPWDKSFNSVVKEKAWLIV